MQHLIPRVIMRTPATVCHHSTAVFTQQLVDSCSEESTPASAQDALFSGALVRRLHLVSALLQEDDEEGVLNTEDELRHALPRGRASSPRDDRINYYVLRLLHLVSGNPLIRLYNMCPRAGCVPHAWIRSTIIPIPKPGTAKFRPISLTSCFCKMLLRILLTRLMYWLQDRLSPRLFGFFLQGSINHYLIDLYSRLSRDSYSFIDLKSAFNVAYQDIILNQHVDFGINGSLLWWTKCYLSNWSSRAFFSGAYNSSQGFLLSTPHGGY